MKRLFSFIILNLCFAIIYAQPYNDLCEDATIIPNIVSDGAFVCISGSTQGALPEEISNGCQIGDFPTVWYKVTTDGLATLLNVQVSSVDIIIPTISIFRQNTDCSDIIPIQVTQSNFGCVVGSNGEAEAFGTDIETDQVYYIAVSSLNSSGGIFDICANTISSASNCVTSRNIQITSRSSGGSLEGPFFPGETIGVCMNVNSYNAGNNGCQWFQGLIPVFGNGWDPSSFDGNGQPLNANINGNGIGVAGNGLYSSATWDWFTDVDYHFDHFNYQLGDFDGNGTIDMCNLLFDPDCPNTGGLMGGCCNPCWGAPLGTILPGGWFAYGNNGSCPTPGPPIRVDWGDGNTCGGGMGPWAFCFELTIRSFPDCSEDPSTSNVSLGFFSFSDGQTGAWTGGASICAFDQPVKISLPMTCCEILGEDEVMLDTIVSGQSINFTIDEPGIEYWIWSVNPGPVEGAMPGSGGPETVIIDTLIYTGPNYHTVYYSFLGYNGSCTVFQRSVSVVVIGIEDLDSDGITDSLDNCVAISNSDQADEDIDGIGDACDFGTENGVGIGTTAPATSLQVTGKSIFIDNNSGGLLMRSPDNSCWIVRIDNNGNLTQIKVPCPE